MIKFPRIRVKMTIFLFVLFHCPTAAEYAQPNGTKERLWKKDEMFCNSPSHRS